MVMKTLFNVALGGAIGSMMRYGVGVCFQKYATSEFPWHTITVNILGSFVMGVLIELMAIQWNISQEWRAFVLVGILGGFTTFSAFSLDFALLWGKGNGSTAFLYLFLSVVGSIAAIFFAMFSIRHLFA
jgi:CrcB protein